MIEQGATPIDQVDMASAQTGQALVAAPEKPEDLSPLLDDARSSAQLRSFFLNRGKFDDSHSEAWALGGSIMFGPGYLAGHPAIGAVAYTSQPVVALALCCCSPARMAPRTSDSFTARSDSPTRFSVPSAARNTAPLHQQARCSDDAEYVQGLLSERARISSAEEQDQALQATGLSGLVTRRRRPAGRAANVDVALREWNLDPVLVELLEDLDP